MCIFKSFTTAPLVANLISDKTKMITMSRKAQSLMKAPKLCIVDHIIGVGL